VTPSAERESHRRGELSRAARRVGFALCQTDPPPVQEKPCKKRANLVEQNKNKCHKTR
jgi:hypothetical protein